MRARKKLTKKQRLIKKISVTIVAVILVIVVYFELTVKDRLELAIVAQIKKVSSTAINDAVSEYLEQNIQLCADMIKINYDSNGCVRSISENMYSVNNFKSKVIDNAQKQVDEIMRSHGIDVQLGNFIGLTIFSEFGPYVHMDIDATTNIDCDIISSFESVGMNQTLHKIGMELFVDIYVGNPFRIESIAYSTSYEISQTVIVGNIPSTYGTISRY